MVKLLVVELTHTDLNLKFDINITYLRLITLLVIGDISTDNDTPLIIDFINFKIKPTIF
jgi:hypothetical protein